MPKKHYKFLTPHLTESSLATTHHFGNSPQKTFIAYPHFVHHPHPFIQGHYTHCAIFLKDTYLCNK